MVVEYYLIGGDGNGNFRVEKDSGKILASAIPDVDYEEKKEYNLVIKATDKGTPPKSSICVVKILVDDINDNAGIFHPSDFHVGISENQPIGTFVTDIYVTDYDTGLNGQTTITLDKSSDPLDCFNLIPTGTGKATIRTTKVLDREGAYQQFEIRLQAVDQGTPQQTVSTEVFIGITDVNDNAPVFEEIINDIRIWENTTVGQSIITVMAKDADMNENAKLRYSITDGDHLGNFAIDPETGQIRLLKELNRELFWQFKLKIKAEDSGSPQMSSEIEIGIIVLDNNDVVPQFSQGYTFSINENAAINRPVGTILATDGDIGSNSQLVYSIHRAQVGSPNHFKIDPNTGTISVNIANIDRETIPTYVLWCRATDSGSPPLFAETRVTIKIQDLNDNTPKFTKPLFTGIITETSPAGQQVALIQAVDLDLGANGIVFFSFKNASIGKYFHLDENTGNLTSLQVFDREKTSEFKFEIRGFDKGAPSLNSYVPVHITIADINDNRPFFPVSMPRKYEMANNEPIGAILFEIAAIDYDTGKNAELKYSISDSSNIFQVDINSGNISFRSSPTEGLTYTFTATVEDSGIPKLSDLTTLTVVIFSKDKVCVAIKLDIPQNKFNAMQTEFTNKLQNELQKSIPEAQIKMCGEPSPTGSPTSRRLLQSASLTVYVYATKRNASSTSNSFIQKDDLIKVLSTDKNGNGGILSSPEFSQFGVSQVTSYPTVPKAAPDPWIQTTTGIAVTSFMLIVVLILIVVVVLLVAYVIKNKPQSAIVPIPSSQNEERNPLPSYRPSKVIVSHHSEVEFMIHWRFKIS